MFDLEYCSPIRGQNDVIRFKMVNELVAWDSHSASRPGFGCPFSISRIFSSSLSKRSSSFLTYRRNFLASFVSTVSKTSISEADVKKSCLFSDAVFFLSPVLLAIVVIVNANIITTTTSELVTESLFECFIFIIIIVKIYGKQICEFQFFKVRCLNICSSVFVNCLLVKWCTVFFLI